MRGIKLLIDNASPYTPKLNKNFLEAEGLDLLLHPSYSPNLAPCDFWLFAKLKIYLQGKNLTRDKPSGPPCTSTSKPSPKKITGVYRSL